MSNRQLTAFSYNYIKLLVLTTLASFHGYSQLTASVLVPQTGIADKQQLWNIVVTNVSTTPITLRIQAVVTERTSGQPVFTAATELITLPMGSTQLSSSIVGVIQYNSSNPNYPIDPGPAGALPAGAFNVCYEFYSGSKRVLQDCYPILVEPFSQLLLQLPLDNAEVNETRPGFSWLQLLQVQGISNISYTFRLAEVNPGQSVSDALERNLPLLSVPQISSTILDYPSTAAGLEPNKHYVWQVSAVNRSAIVAKSEIWNIYTTDRAQVLEGDDLEYYARLKRQDDGGAFALFSGDIKFAYINETADSIWRIKVTDMSGLPSREITFIMPDSIPLLRGENMVRISGKSIAGLKDGHIYLLQLRNSRNEIWQLKFEYRREKE